MVFAAAVMLRFDTAQMGKAYNFIVFLPGSALLFFLLCLLNLITPAFSQNIKEFLLQQITQR